MEFNILILSSFGRIANQLAIVSIGLSILCVLLFLTESLSAVLSLRITKAQTSVMDLIQSPRSLPFPGARRRSIHDPLQGQPALPLHQHFLAHRSDDPTFTNKIHHLPPDDVLSCQKALEDNLQAEWTLLGLLNPHTTINQWHTLPVKVLSGLMVRSVDKMMEEVELGFDAYWGGEGASSGKERRRVDMLETMLKVATRARNRFVFGTEMCRNEQFVAATATFTRQALVGAILIRVFPKFLRPIFERLIAWPKLQELPHFRFIRNASNRGKDRRSEKYDRVAAKRSAMLKTDDILQWHVEYARTQTDPEEFTSDRISRHLMVFNTAAVVSTHMITDPYTMPGVENVGEDIREEIGRVLAEEGGEWNMRGLNRMVKLDSAVKESMRLSSNEAGICARVVLPKEGIKLDSGIYLPQDSTVSVPQWALHHDAALYPNPDAFLILPAPLGVTRRLERRTRHRIFGVNHSREPDLGAGPSCLQADQNCSPGRFFVSAEMKLILAYCLLNYDIEPMTKAPTQRWFGTVYIPSDAPFRVRRRSLVESGDDL